VQDIADNDGQTSQEDFWERNMMRYRPAAIQTRHKNDTLDARSPGSRFATLGMILRQFEGRGFVLAARVYIDFSREQRTQTMAYQDDSAIWSAVSTSHAICARLIDVGHELPGQLIEVDE